MPTLRRLLLPLALVTAFGCARCGRTPPPTERFVAGDSAAALVVPSLEAFARQSADLLATAGSFPFGQGLGDARSVLAGRLGFDPFDAASMAGAGLDAKRGLTFSGKVGARGPAVPDLLLTLPVGDAAKLEETFARLARERLGAPERSVEPGTPEVIAWRAVADGPITFAWALVEQTALVSFGAAPVEAIRAAAAVPATATLGTVPAYQQAMKALGEGLALRFFVPAGSPALAELPQMKDGVAFGIRGGRELLGLSAAMPLGERRAALEEAVASGTSAALAAKLDPRAVLVARGEGGPGSMLDPAELTAALAKQGIPPEAQSLVTDFVGALGGSSAVGLALLAPEGKPASFQAEPLRFVRAELLFGLRDPDAMVSVIQRGLGSIAPQAQPPRGAKGRKGKAAAPSFGANPWRFPLPGGEVAAAVTEGRLAVVAGPAGALEALLARDGTVFKGPTPASDAALKARAGGMFLDVPRLAATLKSLPEAAYGDAEQAMMLKSMVDQYATASERVLALSLRSDLTEGIARGELLLEVAPAPAAAK